MSEVCSAGHCARVPPQKKKKKKISLHPLPAGRLSQPPSPPQGVLDTQRPAAELQQEAHQVQGGAKPVALVRSAVSGLRQRPEHGS